MDILGISCFYHDAAAALLRDGDLARRGPRGALHPQEARPRASQERGAVLPLGGGHRGERPRLSGLLRQALHQVRADAAHLSGHLPPLPALLLQGDADLDEGEALDAESHREGSRIRRRGALRRASPVPRGLGLPSLPLRRGGHPDHRRRGRMGDGHTGSRTRQRIRAVQGDPIPPLPRSALQRLHLLPRLQGQQRRVQGDGRRTLRRAEVLRDDPRAPGRPPGGRLLQAEHEVLRLPLRPHHDQPALREAVRSSAARARIPDGGLPLGHGGERAEGHRGDRSANRPGPPRAHRAPEPLHGGRCRTQLRGQWAHHPGKPLRAAVGTARSGRCGRSARCGAVRGELRAGPPAQAAHGPRVLGPELFRPGDPAFPGRPRRALPDAFPR